MYSDHFATVFLKEPSDHTHEKLSTPQIDIEKARTSVKRKAVEDMHTHVDKMVCEEISASSLSYKHVHTLKSAVYKKRCKLRPFILSTVSILLDLGWYAQRRCTFTLGRNADFGRRAMLLNAENSGIPAATRV